MKIHFDGIRYIFSLNGQINQELVVYLDIHEIVVRSRAKLNVAVARN